MIGRVPQPASKQRQRGHRERSLPRENEHHREERDDRREAPKHLHGLIAGSGERFDQCHGSNRASEHPQHRGAPNFILGRKLGELAPDQIEIIPKPIRIAGSDERRRIGRRFEKQVFIHPPGMPEDG